MRRTHDEERVTNIAGEGTEDVDLRGVNALFTFQHDQELAFFLSIFRLFTSVFSKDFELQF